MKIAVFAYSRQGCRLARRVLTCFPQAECRAYSMARFQEPGFLPFEEPAGAFYGRLFHWADALIFVGACGIAVRKIAPHLQSKQSDPAVLCLDELGSFVIPLLSGHIGGANALARQLAAALEASPVISTATDINDRFSVDSWATENGFFLSDMQLAKAVSAAILEQELPLASDLPVRTPLPPGLFAGESGPLGICISWEEKSPFDKTLRLIPPLLHLGIGCRKGTPAEAIGRAVDAVLKENKIDRRAIRCAASIELKAEEAGLLDYCRQNGWPLSFYSAAELAAVPGDFSPSPFVQSVTGVDNVCERAALLGAKRLLVPKSAADGVTVAIAAEEREVRFD